MDHSILNSSSFYSIDRFISFLNSSDITKEFYNTYGNQENIIQQRRGLILPLLEGFSQHFPQEKKVAVVRVPGRINLMGVHIDHQGGNTNYIPIARETLFCFSPRSDNQISVHNLNPAYPSFQFDIAKETPPPPIPWESFIETVTLKQGFWGNYIKAGALKLQTEYPSSPLRGFNVLIDGDIPPNAGVSSSSTLVVGTVLCLCKVNQLDIPVNELVGLCGSAEWYVGTRGGAGDHSAMLLGKLQKVLNAGFKPFRCVHHPFPSDLKALLIHSGVKSNKATNTRKIFNSRIAAYAISFLIFRETNPEFKKRLEFLRDISPEKLRVSLSDFYPLLKKIPIEMDAATIQSIYPQLKEEIQPILNRYQIEDEKLPLREVLLFGISECQRAKQFPHLLQHGHIQEAGEAIYTSHDGDRISTWMGNHSKPYRSPYDDIYLDKLTDLAANSTTEGSASLVFQPGGYRCSIPAMDRIVDHCKKIPGLVGAGLTGAGLGGAVIALVHSDSAEDILQTLQIELERWFGTNAFVELCHPADGAGFINVPD